MSDKKILHTTSLLTLVALVISFFIGDGGRIAAAILMALVCVITHVLVKKRGIPNFVYSEVATLMAVIAAVYVMLYFLTGLRFGFAKLNYGSTVSVIFKYVVPISVIVVSTEIVRSIMRAQEDKAVDILSYFSSVIAEVLIHYTLSEISSFKKFIDVIALVVLPALLSNLLYHYLAKRYTALPNVIYRLITTLYPYVFLYATGVPKSLLAFVNLIVPLGIYSFIDYLYEKRKRYALSQSSKAGVVITGALIALMALTIMLISNTFTYGAYVVATDSMTGELNKGDIAIYESYEDQEIVEGQVIVFSKGSSKVIHRVVDIAHINGQTRYYTKGDINGDLDDGYITENNILGVVELKLPYFGYPTLWLRELVKNIL